MRPFSYLHLLLAIASIVGCNSLQLYPLDKISIQEIKPQSDHTILIDVGPATSQYTSQVETLSDRIIVRFQPCEYCKHGGKITIENPHDLPIYFADNEVTRQVYPVNETVSEHEP
jgi:hypothetical protein